MIDLSAHLPQQRLQDALGTLDAVFAPLGKSSVPVGGCTHCFTEAELHVLAGPVREVPDELVYSVTHKVPDHWDDFPALYRRLTPRIVRLLVADRLDHGLVASRLLTAGWREWPVTERRALEEVWYPWWRSVLHAHPSVGHVTDVLETLAATTGTLAPWLAVWAGTRTEAADLHLGDALDRWLVEDGLADLRLGFYGETHATPELLPWLLSLEEDRVGAGRLREIERIAYGG
ncbi:hypothetical protein PV379_46530 [Streptomyces caniscabiei]|uniref:hypothetical protein n=1 Tax=Streptomyces caniscabiei TaxID=2746961 RepID=UPI0029B7A85D|nr:hypothetical protein [Streptomyces caniscabiei]MDX2598492.1 hypothetical protein [Streptomyces caniscabiei]MDX2740935.1 hypothetical protein [Streptomyces caniscabiei]MDX2784712.1 hypothetical protein [Streptomyces caniscabiei]